MERRDGDTATGQAEMGQATVYAFEWDPAKALLNAKKHGVSYEEEPR